MFTINLLDDIQYKYKSFSEKEKRIADYILKNSNDIKNINIKDLAKLTQTSPSTITRFCQKIPCENFSNMKILLSSINPISEENIENDLLDDVHLYYKEVIDKTKSILDVEKIYIAVKEIINANKIYIYGVGNSGITAEEFMLRLLRMGLSVNAITDTHMMLINSSITSKNDVIIGISVSGETEEIINALKIAKKNNSKLISITSNGNSELATLADINLLTYNTLFLNKSQFINSQFSIMYLLDIISTILLKNEDFESKMQKTLTSIKNSI